MLSRLPGGYRRQVTAAIDRQRETRRAAYKDYDRLCCVSVSGPATWNLSNCRLQLCTKVLVDKDSKVIFSAVSTSGDSVYWRYIKAKIHYTTFPVASP